MFRLPVSVAATILVTVTGAPTHAWWDFARWGLTEQQTVAASKGRAQPCDERCVKMQTDNDLRLIVPSRPRARRP